ncbi:MAG TPA: AsmA-like C-terminal region-containing protein [Pseudorhizobium sp.]|nr:AsmA-like C-terminal region-containing protein [Pseudorhizobium sp.]
MRALLLIVLGIILIVALFRVAAPFVIQTTVVRAGIERAITRWTGHDVAIEGETTISFWPQPRIEVERVTVSKVSSGEVQLLSRATKLSAGFGLYQAIQGRAEFEDFHLVNPEIFVLRDRNGRLDWANGGQLSAAARSVEASGTALDPALDLQVGEIEIENGRIEVRDLSTGETWRATGINGDIRWPSLSAAASAHVTAQVGGQVVRLDLSSPQPLLLLTGNTAPFEGSVASPLLSGRFAGSANLAQYGFASGELEVATPDVAEMAAWIGTQPLELPPVTQFQMTAQLLTTEGTLRFEDMQLALNGSSGRGVVDFYAPPTGAARLTGTLAFESLDMRSLIEAITRAPVEKENPKSPAALALDLRLSGEEATLGPLSLTEVAVSIMNRAEEARVDILDGTVAGGRVTARIIGNGGNFGAGGNLRFTVGDADLAQLARSLGLEGPLPEGQGSVEADISFNDRPSFGALATGRGDLRIKSRAGVLPDIDPIVLLHRISTQSYLPLLNPDGEDFEYEKLELEVRLAEGVLQVRRAMIEGGSFNVSLSGIVSSRNGGLALSAVISPSPEEIAKRIFIGGNWPDAMAIEVP